MPNVITGIVKRHKGRGKTLGFPTANLEIDKNAEEGIFLGFTRINNAPQPFLRLRRGEGEILPSLIFIGASKTFGETDKKAEIYILGFAGDLYGKELKVELVKKLRENVKFNSKEELIEQMREDERLAREYFNQI